MAAELDRAEQKVEDESAALRKELGLRDLVLTQILFVVGSSWVGTAAKLGHAHLVFWLLAIAFFYIPQAAVVIYLNRLMPMEGGLYQWAKLGFNEFVGFIVAWNLWLLSITVIALGGMFVTINLSYALGQSWMPNSKWCVSLISCALVLGLGWSGVRGLSLGKWVHNIGAFAMLLVYGALILLPFFALARGELKEYHPLQIAAPAMSIFYCFNIFSKLAVGALSGFEYVAILAGETRAPGRDIGRSVIIASPVIALMFILGTSSVLAFVGNNPIDLIGPVPQTLRLGLHAFPIAGAIASAGIVLMTVRTISSTSVHLTGSSRLPMVAGWDRLLPVWFRVYTQDTRRRLTLSSSLAWSHWSSRFLARSAPEFRKPFNSSTTPRMFFTELFMLSYLRSLSPERPLFARAHRCGYASPPSAGVPFHSSQLGSPSIRSSMSPAG